MIGAQPIGEGELQDLFAPLEPFRHLILAVSGGADSVAMMHLVARWAQLQPDPARTIVVATVDHGLRPASRSEAQWVEGEARAIGLTHETLSWEGVKPATGLQDAAREARYRLLAELGWRLCNSGAVAIVTAHTEDDQAETFLMRLARGSGVDGLTGMQEQRFLGSDRRCRLVRPLLGVAGARLRATLAARGQGWIEDPSNEQDRFERVRLRKARGRLEQLGLSNEKIALSARRLERARDALEAAATQLQLAAKVDAHGGAFASLDADVLLGAAVELRLRVMGRLIAAFGGQDDPPRLARLESLVERLADAAFEAATLGGCMVCRHGREIRVFREPGRVPLPELTLAPGGSAIWDRRFRVWASAELGAPVAVRALGGPGFALLRKQLEGASGLPPARAAATLPAFWQGATLLAVPPLLGPDGPFAGSDKGGTRLCSAEFLW